MNESGKGVTGFLNILVFSCVSLFIKYVFAFIQSKSETFLSAHILQLQ